MECVGRIAAVRGRIRERFNNLLKLDGRAEPAVGDDKWRPIRMLRSDVDKMDAQNVDRSLELRELI